MSQNQQPTSPRKTTRELSPKKFDPYQNCGKVLKNKYEIIEFIEEGGMGIVYKGFNLDKGNSVAIKILPPRYLADPDKSRVYLGLFHKEGELLKYLRHPNIVTVYETGTHDNLTYIVMEWLNGVTLGQEITKVGRFSPSRTSHILTQICSALDFAHSQKIVHLDIKANNVFLVGGEEELDRVKVIDFGLSRIVQSTLGSTISRVVGTPQYMAPEVFENKASHLSDVYSLGVLTYEMLTGVLPFSSTHIFSLVRQQLTADPPSVRVLNPEVTQYNEDLIKRSLAKRSLDRPRGVRELGLEFQRGLTIKHSYEPRSSRVFGPAPTVYLDDPFVGRKKQPFFKKLLFCGALFAPFVTVGLAYSGVDGGYINSQILIATYLVCVLIVGTILLFHTDLNHRIRLVYAIPLSILLLIPGLIISTLFAAIALAILGVFFTARFLIKRMRRQEAFKRADNEEESFEDERV